MTVETSPAPSRVADPSATVDDPLPGVAAGGAGGVGAAQPRLSTETRPPARFGTDDPAAWLLVCPLARLQPGRGVAALVGDVQVAVFRMTDGSLHALGNIDPFTGAAVVSRGIVGDRDGVPTVASPVHKQAFSLVDGRCLDDPAVHLPVYRARASGDDLWIGLR